MRWLSLLLVCLLALAVAPTVAGARDPQVNAPPGTSGIDEYLETVPDAEGNRPASPGSGGGNGVGAPGRPGRPGSGGGGAATVPPGVRRELERTAEGRAALALAAAGAPPARPRSGASTPAPARPLQARGQARGDGLLSAVAKSLTGSGSDGLGFGLPLLLVASVLAIGLLAAARRRRR